MELIHITRENNKNIFASDIIYLLILLLSFFSFVSYFTAENSSSFLLLLNLINNTMFGNLKVIASVIFIYFSIMHIFDKDSYCRPLFIKSMFILMLVCILAEAFNIEGGVVANYIAKNVIDYAGRVPLIIFILFIAIAFALLEFNIGVRQLPTLIHDLYTGRSTLKYSKDNTNKPNKNIMKTKPFIIRKSINNKAKLIDDTLKNYNIDAYVETTVESPSVVSYQLKIGEGQKIAPIKQITNEFAYILKNENVRINDTNGKVFLELVKKNKSIVNFQNTINLTNNLTEISLGIDTSGNIINFDLTEFPHLLIAGTTGGGKSSFIHTLICNLIMKNTPSTLQLVLIDCKLVELSAYENIPHLLLPVVTTAEGAIKTLNSLEAEMYKRYETIKNNNSKDIKSYNAKSTKKLGIIVVIIDELAILMQENQKKTESPIKQLTAVGRACGIHLILSTQKPVVSVVTGVIKGNTPSRIAFTVSNQSDSRVILDEIGAEKLTGKGDMLFKPIGAQTKRLQSAYIEEHEVNAIVAKTINKYGAFVNKQETKYATSKKHTFNDNLTNTVVINAIKFGSISVSLIRQQHNIGCNRATNILTEIENFNILSEKIPNKPRQITISLVEWEELKKVL